VKSERPKPSSRAQKKDHENQAKQTINNQQSAINQFRAPEPIRAVERKHKQPNCEGNGADQSRSQ
jgi:hypothetical protein